MNASTADKIANSLLDFIAIRESAGNYDAYIGHANAQGTFDGRTIADVYRMQSLWVAGGLPSSAAGRYQFIKATLQGLVVQNNLPTTTPFTPVLQDQLATCLLNTRGYSHWLAGAIDDEMFMHNLSCEWASLPDPKNDGKSHYDGVGPNHAGQTLEAFQAALTAARAA